MSRPGRSTTRTPGENSQCGVEARGEENSPDTGVDSQRSAEATGGKCAGRQPRRPVTPSSVGFPLASRDPDVSPSVHLSGGLLLTALAGIRPDGPARTVTLRPVRSAPLGELGLSGLRVVGAPFAVRISRLGLAMVEEAADDLRLGS